MGIIAIFVIRDITSGLASGCLRNLGIAEAVTVVVSIPDGLAFPTAPLVAGLDRLPSPGGYFRITGIAARTGDGNNEEQRNNNE